MCAELLLVLVKGRWLRWFDQLVRQSGQGLPDRAYKTRRAVTCDTWGGAHNFWPTNVNIGNNYSAVSTKIHTDGLTRIYR